MTQRLTISFRQKQLFWNNDPYDPIYVNCDVDGMPTYIHGAVPDNGWTDMTDYTEGLDKLKLSWQATGGESESGSLGSNDLGSNYQKGISLELRFIGPAFQYIYGWLMTNPCQILNAVEVLITDLDCAKSYRIFEIKLDNVKYAPFDEPCIVSMVLREKDDAIHVFQKTIIEDDWQQWFNSDGAGVKDHPSFIFVVEKRPKFFLTVLVALGFIVGILSGGLAFALEGFKEWLRKLIGVCYFSPSPLIRSYIENICDKYGFTHNTMFDDLPENPYRNVCMFFPTQKDHHNFDGFDADINLFDWDNRTGLAFSLFLDKLKKVFNAEWYVTPNKELVFQPRNYFNNLPPIYDFTQPGAFKLYNFFYEFNGQKKPAYGDYQYKIDPQDACSNDLKWRYNSIVDFDGPANNPMLEGHITKEFDYACTSFMYDGATEDFLEAAIKLGRIVAVVVTVSFISYLVGAFLSGVLTVGGAAVITAMYYSGLLISSGWFNDFFGNDKLRGAVRVASNNINIPRLLLWDGESMTRAKVLRWQDPVQNPYYNTEGNNYYEAHPAFDADAGYFGSEVIDIPNYDMVIDEDFYGNLYDRFHESDNPLKNPEINQTWQADIDLCCEVGDLLGFWEGDFVKIGAVVIIENRNGRIISGRIGSIAPDYDKGNVHLTGVVLKSTGVDTVIVPTCDGDAPTITSIVNNPDGGVTITGTATPLTVIKIFGSDTEFGTYLQLGNSYTAQNLNDGLIILPESLVGTNEWFKLSSTNSNCDYGFSAVTMHILDIPCPDVTPLIFSIEASGADLILSGVAYQGATIIIYGSDTEFGSYVQVGPDYTEVELEAGITFATTYKWLKIGASDALCDYGFSAVVNVDTTIEQFVECSGITDATQIAALIRLKDDLKGVSNGSYATTNIWDKFIAIYPFVGGTAATHKCNFKDPRDLDAAFRLVFNGSPTHDANGVHWNGTTQYAETYITPNVYCTQDNTHLSYYTRDNIIANANEIEIGINSGGVDEISIYAYWAGLGFGSRMYNPGSQIFSTAPGSSLGFSAGSRVASNDFRIFRNGVQVGATNTAASGSLPGVSGGVGIWIGALNANPVYYSTKGCAFASVGDGLTVAESLNFYNAVQHFQTTLSRQV